MDVFDAIRRDPLVERLAGLLQGTATPLVVADGLWGSSAPILAALLAERLHRPLLLVTPHSDEADDFRDDIETATGISPELLPALEHLPGEAVADDELAAERLRLCVELLARWPPPPARTRKLPNEKPALAARSELPPPPFLVASIQALMQPVPSAQAIASSSLTVSVGEVLDPETFTTWLAERGFERCDQVEVPGDFARRGGILDVFAHSHTDPVRIEFFGDTVESIRLFDAGTQRSTHTLQSAQVPARTMLTAPSSRRSIRERAEETAGFLTFLPPDTIVALHEPSETQELGRTYWQRLGERAGIIPAEGVLRHAARFAQLYLLRFAAGEANAVSLGVASLPRFEARTPDAFEALRELAAECEAVVLCDNAAEQQRLRELFEESDRAAEQQRAQPAHAPDPSVDAAAPPEAGSAAPPPAPSSAPPVLLARRVKTAVGVIHRGFRWRDLAFVPHHELFHRFRQKRTLRRVAPARPIDSFFDLNTGDHVVHVLHGIGKFLGLKTIDREDRQDEYLAIEFADHAVVHVSTSQVHLVQKYIGSARGKPKLSKLGGNAWKRTTQRVADAVTDMAGDLLAVQAQRATQEGVAYPQDTTWQKEFEGSFLFTETEDQLRTLAEIKQDMGRPRPMDRLLCGDVGYGKTELAMRAAFKTIEYGKQVAVLVPTTVLAEQHFQTFRERMADYPFTVESLSRFRSKPEQTRIVNKTREGLVDVLIGTHRLLSADVRFADLGLVVIDEEQRFGVEAKEKLKRLRATVDVLTLSATPIPRTLHMAMLGIRDISSLATPPLDRRSIVTQVRMWEDALIRDAIVRELNREGQVYFVHNFVRDIHEVANRVRTLVPDARVVVGHGQMGGAELEDVMLKFMHREADVLVSTNIIESGLDIPSANTIFINRAERFGLADLHQLRGRVGRSRHRAYAYMLLSPKHPIKDTAARRLKAIEHYSDLGAGFQIAMRDLEIRGAGNILGAEQSGHIEAVGYEMYCQLLEQAVRRMKNEPGELWRPVNLELGVSASIPRSYIRAEKQRMEVYKRLAVCHRAEDVQTLQQDLRDAFGAPPADVETLLLLAEVRALSQPWGIRSIVLKDPDVIFAVDDLHKTQPLFASSPGTARVPDPHTIHWRLPKRFLEMPTLLHILRKQLGSRPAAAAQPATIPAL